MERNPDSDPHANPRKYGSKPRLPTTSREYIIGDMIRSNVAIGDGAMVIVNEAISNAKQAQAQEDYEREKLAQAVADHVRGLFEQLSAPRSAEGKPFKYLLPYDLSDTTRFFGRDSVIEELLAKLTCQDSSCRLAVLHGHTGIGKTSVLQAGLVPALIAAQHLPLQVRVTGADLSSAIKESLPLNLNLTPILREASLQEFLRQLVDLLPHGKHVFVLLDQFEAFFEQSPGSRLEFTEQMARCLFDADPRDHWLICIRSSFVGHLHSLDPTLPIAAQSNQIVLPPLSYEEARATAMEPIRLRKINFEGGLIESILNDLGGDNIDPSRLQLVLSTLTESMESGEAGLTIASYRRLGGEAGIYRDHLEVVLNRNLNSDARESAWQLLSVLVEKPEGITSAELRNDLTLNSLNQSDSLNLLRILENNHLVQQRGETYVLTSDSLMAPIKSWTRQRAAAEQVREEVARQVRNVRASALRGLFGGALGFCLAYVAAYRYQTDNLSLLPINTAYEAMPGAIAGLLLILTVDIAMSSYHGRRRRMRWIVGAIGGGIAFGQALLIHNLLNVQVDDLSLLRVALQGMIWGAVVGTGTIWVMSSGRRWWQSLAVVTVISGVIFWLADSIGRAFQRPRLQLSNQNLDGLIILAGAIMPLMVISAALLGHRSEQRSIKKESSDE